MGVEPGRYLSARILLNTVALLALAPGARSMQPVQADLIAFSLQDHDRTTYTAQRWNGRRLVLFLADRQGSGYDRNFVWTSSLVASIKSLASGADSEFVSIADLRSVPRLARGLVRGMFAPRSQDPVGLTLLDWNGRMFEAYGLEPAAFHMLVFDQRHTLVYRVALREFSSGQLTLVQNALQDIWAKQ